MSTVSPSQILRKLKKPIDTDKDDPRQKSTTDKQGDDANDEKMPGATSKRNALIDFIAKAKKPKNSKDKVTE